MKALLGIILLLVVLACSSYAYKTISPQRAARMATVEIENNNFYDARIKIKHLGHPVLSLFVRSGQTVSREVDSIYDTIYFSIDFIGTRSVWQTQTIYLVAEQTVVLRIGQTLSMTFLSRR